MLQLLWKCALSCEGCKKLVKLKVTGSDGQGLVKPDLHRVRVGRQTLVSGVSVHLAVYICEAKTRFLIDPGTEITIMSQKLFEKIPEKIRPKIANECKMKLEVADKGMVE